MTTIHFLSCALSTLLFASFISADCECGYKVNNTLYTDLIETDFLHLPSITNDIDWQPQNYTVTPADARGPYGKNASLSNVLANPLKSQYDWAGDGVNGGDAGLQLYVRGSAQGLDSLIPMAELVTTRDDVLYGSFRAGMKFTPVNGTCGAFFWVSRTRYSQFAPPSKICDLNFSLTYSTGTTLKKSTLNTFRPRKTTPVTP